MVAIDTNILIRVLVDEPDAPWQTEAARRFVASNDRIYIPQIVQVECVWVLRSVYAFEKLEIAERLIELTRTRYILQGERTFLKALQLYRTSSADFADCLILAEAQEQGCLLFSFDKKLGKETGARLLRPA